MMNNLAYTPYFPSGGYPTPYPPVQAWDQNGKGYTLPSPLGQARPSVYDNFQRFPSSKQTTLRAPQQDKKDLLKLGCFASISIGIATIAGLLIHSFSKAEEPKTQPLRLTLADFKVPEAWKTSHIERRKAVIQLVDSIWPEIEEHVKKGPEDERNWQWLEDLYARGFAEIGLSHCKLTIEHAKNNTESNLQIKKDSITKSDYFHLGTLRYYDVHPGIETIKTKEQRLVDFYNVLLHETQHLIDNLVEDPNHRGVYKFPQVKDFAWSVLGQYSYPQKMFLNRYYEDKWSDVSSEHIEPERLKRKVGYPGEDKDYSIPHDDLMEMIKLLKHFDTNEDTLFKYLRFQHLDKFRSELAQMDDVVFKEIIADFIGEQAANYTSAKRLTEKGIWNGATLESVYKAIHYRNSVRFCYQARQIPETEWAPIAFEKLFDN